MTVHVAITRKVRPGCEEQFLRELKQFFQLSFAHSGMYGVNLITPPPGSGSQEYGIIRTFANETERDAFYRSDNFTQWSNRVQALTEGKPRYRQLHGLEAWFRGSAKPPPRWKMAVITYFGVYSITLPLLLYVSPLLKSLPFVIQNAIFNAIVVSSLTWVIMPVFIRVTRGWLNAGK